ncbi:Transmembrane protein 17A [Liparis tanakae]|uniref:Transmembrane protein 17A n=1 Tax=Liparis tanakae TaxID=230148 RepID=A0A4Z2FST6_9TELE|nr:Transmembrane protein 17A [Liparis tanakae]
MLAQILASFLALRTMTRKLTLLFHLRQFGEVESLQHAGMSPVSGLPYRRSETQIRLRKQQLDRQAFT